jgi:hypothetical protein
MTQAQAKKIVCALAVNLMDGRCIVEEYQQIFPKADAERLAAAWEDFAQEMFRRSGTEATYVDMDDAVVAILGDAGRTALAAEGGGG